MRSDETATQALSRVKLVYLQATACPYVARRLVFEIAAPFVGVTAKTCQPARC